MRLASKERAVLTVLHASNVACRAGTLYNIMLHVHKVDKQAPHTHNNKLNGSLLLFVTLWGDTLLYVSFITITSGLLVTITSSKRTQRSTLKNTIGFLNYFGVYGTYIGSI